MDPLQVEAEAGGRHGAAEAANQVVVAAAAPEDVAQRGVVDLDDRARVVAEVAEQAQVELNPAGNTLLDQQVVGLLEALGRTFDGHSTELARLLQNLGPATQAGQPQQGFPSVGIEAVDRVHLRLEAHEVVLSQAIENSRAVLSLDTELG